MSPHRSHNNLGVIQLIFIFVRPSLCRFESLFSRKLAIICSVPIVTIVFFCIGVSQICLYFQGNTSVVASVHDDRSRFFFLSRCITIDFLRGFTYSGYGGCERWNERCRRCHTTFEKVVWHLSLHLRHPRYPGYAALLNFFKEYSNIEKKGLLYEERELIKLVRKI